MKHPCCEDLPLVLCVQSVTLPQARGSGCWQTWLTGRSWGPARESWQRERRSENTLKVRAHHSCEDGKECLLFSGAAVREFWQRTDGLQVLLSQAVLLGHSEIVEEAVQLSNSCFSQFKEGSQEFFAELEGIHLISSYKGVNAVSRDTRHDIYVVGAEDRILLWYCLFVCFCW